MYQRALRGRRLWAMNRLVAIFRRFIRSIHVLGWTEVPKPGHCMCVIKQVSEWCLEFSRSVYEEVTEELASLGRPGLTISI